MRQGNWGPPTIPAPARVDVTCLQKRYAALPKRPRVGRVATDLDHGVRYVGDENQCRHGFARSPMDS